MAVGDSFSRRNRYAGAGKEITVREDAPEGLRVTVLETARELGWGPSSQRNIVCRVLRARPDPGNWSEYPNVWGEVPRHGRTRRRGARPHRRGEGHTWRGDQAEPEVTAETARHGAVAGVGLRLERGAARRGGPRARARRG